jgi:hypothetical protein
MSWRCSGVDFINLHHGPKLFWQILTLKFCTNFLI